MFSRITKVFRGLFTKNNTTETPAEVPYKVEAPVEPEVAVDTTKPSLDWVGENVVAAEVKKVKILAVPATKRPKAAKAAPAFKQWPTTESMAISIPPDVVEFPIKRPAEGGINGYNKTKSAKPRKPKAPKPSKE